MRIISHRGNIFGPNPQKENKPEYICEAIDKGFDCEVDVWFNGSGYNYGWWLGHDKEQHKISLNFLLRLRKKLFIHAKSIKTLEELIRIDNQMSWWSKLFGGKLEYFFHDQDDCTLTSKKFIWTFPKVKNYLYKTSIAVMPERADDWYGLMTCYGVCTDYPSILQHSKNGIEFYNALNKLVK